MTNYTIINHEARIKFGLTINEYAVADLIYHLSNNPKSEVPGWCYASKEKIAELLGLTKRGINKIIQKLVEKKLIERRVDKVNKSVGNHLRITFNWYETVLIKEGGNEIPTEVKGGNKVPKRWEQSSHNKDNNKDIVITKVISKPSVYGNPEINLLTEYFLKRFELPRLDLSEKINRQYAHLLLKRSRDGVNGVLWLIDVATQDGWYKNHITSFKDLWNNQVKIVANIRGGVQKKKGGFVDASV